jgi:hypothetical protein
MDLFAFRPLNGKQKKDNPLRARRLCGELLPTKHIKEGIEKLETETFRGKRRKRSPKESSSGKY